VAISGSVWQRPRCRPRRDLQLSTVRPPLRTRAPKLRAFRRGTPHPRLFYALRSANGLTRSHGRECRGTRCHGGTPAAQEPGRRQGCDDERRPLGRGPGAAVGVPMRLEPHERRQHRSGLGGLPVVAEPRDLRPGAAPAPTGPPRPGPGCARRSSAPGKPCGGCGRAGRTAPRTAGTAPSWSSPAGRPIRPQRS
jgi:hypothetical protein